MLMGSALTPVEMYGLLAGKVDTSLRLMAKLVILKIFSCYNWLFRLNEAILDPKFRKTVG